MIGCEGVGGGCDGVSSDDGVSGANSDCESIVTGGAMVLTMLLVRRLLKVLMVLRVAVLLVLLSMLLLSLLLLTFRI